ncbi:transcriptional modulator of MazE/toxin, MazF [Rippkaea orientalis PCC 8801]|uniref:mRNA interferase n=1 Tax=Rippkaea orientalis (strain PCC 8801 / RF-1) TaxID=41431 RepID=B7JY77_RIPO1|nr:type II toxin-antitoxin system PemK/MazF family toxin [Rippkaea orientalis]ACK67179.1 transcriptional modulator of MazE/toxin, MazF [Rippkaea orientalis PCC 8801]
MPKGNLTYQRGEIRWVRLDPTVGAEAKKTRSCLIVQNDIMNQYGLLTIVMPLRPGNKQAPYAVNIQASSANGLDQDRFIDVGQIRAVDGQRVLGLLGILEENYWQLIQRALQLVLGFSL